MAVSHRFRSRAVVEGPKGKILLYSARLSGVCATTVWSECRKVVHARCYYLCAPRSFVVAVDPQDPAPFRACATKHSFFTLLLWYARVRQPGRKGGDIENDSGGMSILYFTLHLFCDFLVWILYLASKSHVFMYQFRRVFEGWTRRWVKV